MKAFTSFLGGIIVKRTSCILISALLLINCCLLSIISASAYDSDESKNNSKLGKLYGDCYTSIYSSNESISEVKKDGNTIALYDNLEQAKKREKPLQTSISGSIKDDNNAQSGRYSFDIPEYSLPTEWSLSPINPHNLSDNYEYQCTSNYIDISDYSDIKIDNSNENYNYTLYWYDKNKNLIETKEKIAKSSVCPVSTMFINGDTIHSKYLRIVITSPDKFNSLDNTKIVNDIFMFFGLKKQFYIAELASSDTEVSMSPVIYSIMIDDYYTDRIVGDFYDIPYGTISFKISNIEESAENIHIVLKGNMGSTSTEEQVYTGKTDDNGKCTFKVPIYNTYYLNTLSGNMYYTEYPTYRGIEYSYTAFSETGKYICSGSPEEYTDTSADNLIIYQDYVLGGQGWSNANVGHKHPDRTVNIKVSKNPNADKIIGQIIHAKYKDSEYTNEPIANVKVALYDNREDAISKSDSYLDTVITNDSGFYMFSKPKTNGTYYVAELTVPEKIHLSPEVQSLDVVENKSSLDVSPIYNYSYGKIVISLSSEDNSTKTVEIIPDKPIAPSLEAKKETLKVEENNKAVTMDVPIYSINYKSVGYQGINYTIRVLNEDGSELSDKYTVNYISDAYAKYTNSNHSDIADNVIVFNSYNSSFPSYAQPYPGHKFPVRELKIEVKKKVQFLSYQVINTKGEKSTAEIACSDNKLTYIGKDLQKNTTYFILPSQSHEYGESLSRKSLIVDDNNNITFDSKIRGDLNSDDLFNISDVTFLQKCLAKLIHNTPSTDLADFNGDNIINIKDATKMQRDLVGLTN